MDIDAIITDEDNMTIKNNKKRGIKDTAIVLSIILIVFLIVDLVGSHGVGLMIIWIIIIGFVFLLSLIDYFFQCRIFIEVSGENITLRKYGKKEINICSDEIREIYFSESLGGENDSYRLIIKYGKNKNYKLPLSEPLEIEKIEKFFIQYCNKRNIKVNG